MKQRTMQMTPEALEYFREKLQLNGEEPERKKHKVTFEFKVNEDKLKKKDDQGRTK